MGVANENCSDVRTEVGKMIYCVFTSKQRPECWLSSNLKKRGFCKALLSFGSLDNKNNPLFYCHLEQQYKVKIGKPCNHYTNNLKGFVSIKKKIVMGDIEIVDKTTAYEDNEND